VESPAKHSCAFGFGGQEMVINVLIPGDYNNTVDGTSEVWSLRRQRRNNGYGKKSHRVPKAPTESWPERDSVIDFTQHPESVRTAQMDASVG
jgi:hypothetical protein